MARRGHSGPTLIAVDEARSGLPSSLAPMRPRLAAAPFNSPDHLLEVKWDGIRAILANDGGRVRLADRRGGDLLPLLPELRDVRIPEGALLDGEVIVCDARGRPSHDLLAGRLGPRGAVGGRSTSRSTSSTSAGGRSRRGRSRSGGGGSSSSASATAAAASPTTSRATASRSSTRRWSTASRGSSRSAGAPRTSPGRARPTG
ncbi:MAG: hypothetical protein FJ028_06090 [Chloroflexi bacterium]|nr:hypothetical protein [Chloroflexota bacterium]